MEIATNRRAESIDYLTRFWEQRRRQMAEQTNARPTTIALSRQAGAGGDTIGAEIARQLGWHVYDDELVEKIASDVGVRGELLKSVDERRGNWLRDAFKNLLGVPYVAETVYVHRLVKTVLALGAHGDCVIVGRGAAFILPHDSTFRVRLIAPLEHRIQIWRRRFGVDEATARKTVVAVDRERAAFVRDHFFHEPEPATNYDMVANTASFSNADCAGLVVEGWRRWNAAMERSLSAKS